MRSTLGSSVAVVRFRILLRRDDYAVVHVTLAPPARDVVVKLAGPRAPIACPFERTEAIVDLVRRRTSVPTFEVLAVDVSYRDCPWRYMITSHVPGVTWSREASRRGAEFRPHVYREFGQAVAELHSLSFSAFWLWRAAGTVCIDVDMGRDGIDAAHRDGIASRP